MNARIKPRRPLGAALALMAALAVGAAAQAAGSPAVRLYQEGLAELDQEHSYRAIELFKQAQDLNPNYIEPLVSLAAAYYYLDEYDEALRYVQKAIPLGRDNPRLLNINGRILLALGKTEDAAILFKSVLAREPYNVDALLGLAEFSLSRGDDIGALSQYQKSLQYNPKDRRILLALSLMYESKGDRRKSEQYLMKALDAWAESPLVQAMAAEYYLRRQDWSQAQFHAQTALSLSPGYVKALQLLGTVNLRQGKYAEVVSIMDQLIKLENRDPLAWYLRGMALLQLKQPAPAIASFEKDLQIQPNDEIARIVLEDTVMQSLAPEDPARARHAAYHFDQAAQYRKKNFNQRAAFHYRRGLLIAPMDMAGRQAYAEFLKSNGQMALFYQQLRILVEKGNVQNNFVKDNLEVYGSLLSTSVAASWNVDQYLVDRDPLLLRLYYIPARQNIEHPMAEPYLARYAQTLLLMSPKVAMNADRSETSRLVEPRRVENESQAFAQSRDERVDYYCLLDLSESGDDFQAKIALHLARTGNALRQHAVFRTGNFRVQNAVAQLSEAVQAELPLRGHLLRRNLDEGLVNLGRVDGLKVGDVLTLASPDAYVLKGDAPGFVFSAERKTGTFTVAKVDDLIAAGTVKREGFFDKINLGDVILRDGESQGKNLQPTAAFPFLYNKIRAIR